MRARFSETGKKVISAVILAGSGFLIGQSVTIRSYDWQALSSSVRFYTHAAYYRGCIEGRDEHKSSNACTLILRAHGKDLEAPNYVD